MTGVLIKRGNLDIATDSDRWKIHSYEDIGDDDHLQAKRRNLKQILPSRPSEGPHLLTP